MTLPPDFQFSQTNLQDYVDCARRFELRYLLHVQWPAPISEPVQLHEQHMLQGHRFHRMVQQHLAGIPAQHLTPGPEDTDLQRWWQHYLEYKPLDGLPEQRYPEHLLSAPLAGFRLVAQYDLVAVEPGQRVVILDWKTQRKKPSLSSQKNRLQTRLYPFLMVMAGERLNGGQPLQPEQVELIYWFTEFPTEPQRIPYSASQYEADRRDLAGLITTLSQQQPGEFPLTPRRERCAFCNYRSLCDRGVKAGDWQQANEELQEEPPRPLEIDFDQIGEISF